QSWVAERAEAPRRNAISDVAKFLGPQFGEIAQHSFPEQLRMELRDAVDHVTADRREMRHAHGARFAFIDQRESCKTGFIAGEFHAHLFEKTSIDFVDD